MSDATKTSTADAVAQRDDVEAGIVLGLLAQFLMVPLAIISLFGIGMLSPLAGLVGLLLPIAFWGLAQMIYMGPLFFRALNQGRKQVAIGYVIAASIVCLLHAAAVIWMTPVSRWE